MGVGDFVDSLFEADVVEGDFSGGHFLTVGQADLG